MIFLRTTAAVLLTILYVAPRHETDGRARAHTSIADDGTMNGGSCSFRRWGTASPAFAARGSVARFPRIAAGRVHNFIVGVNIQRFDAATIADRPLVVAPLGGECVGTPAGDFSFLFPRAAVDASGRLHLVWGEATPKPGSLNARDWYFQRPTSLWTASYDAKSGWSEAHLLQQSSRAIAWTARSGSGSFGNEGATGSFSAQIITSEPWLPQPLAYFLLDDKAGLIGGTMTPKTMAAYSSVYVGGAARYVAYVAAASSVSGPVAGGNRSDNNSVFFAKSHDGGKTWTDGRLVSLSGDLPAFQIQLMVDRDGSIHLFWQQTTTSGTAVLRHVASRDEGDSWSQPDDAPLPEHIDGLVAAIDGCGTMHFAFEDWTRGANDLSLAYIAWNGSWSPVSHPFGDFEAMTPDIRAGAGGAPILAFVGRPRASGDSSYRTWVARME